jgi:hypothetical protein
MKKLLTFLIVLLIATLAFSGEFPGLSRLFGPVLISGTTSEIKSATGQNLLLQNGSADKIGISEDSPDSKLHVKDGVADGSYVVTVENTTLGGEFLHFINSLGNSIFVCKTDVQGSSKIELFNYQGFSKVRLSSSSSEKSFISSGADFGVGTTIPLTQFDLLGDFTIRNSEVTAYANDAAITHATGTMRVVGSGGAVTLDTEPAIADGEGNGEILIIQGTSDTNTVTIVDNCNVQLDGGTSWVGGKGDKLIVQWDPDDSDWYELGRTNN